MKSGYFDSLAFLVDYVNRTDWSITDVDTVADTVSVNGNILQRLGAGDSFDIAGSTGNDGTYTVDTITTVGGRTVITTVQDITDPTVDGSVQLSAIVQGKVQDIRPADGLWWLTWWE